MSHRFTQRQLDAGNPGKAGMDLGSSILDAGQMWGAIGQLMARTKNPMSVLQDGIQAGMLHIPDIQGLISGKNQQS